uniref:MIF4G n=1 Tax=Hemiscolopendra marginata TaxID=943146 RepID=A0A646QFT0_9MYRI
MSEEESRPSPGLNMEHGFVRKIERNQHIREQQSKEDISKRIEVARMARKVGMPTKTSKPTMEIYRPPSLRGSGDFSPGLTKNSISLSPSSDPSASQRIHPLSASCYKLPNGNNSSNVFLLPEGATAQNPSLYGSKPGVPVSRSASLNTCAIHSSTSMTAAAASTTVTHTSKVHFQLQVPSNTALVNQNKMAGSFGLKRSKSLGAADMKLSVPNDYDLGGFGLEIQGMIRKALDDPNRLSPRQLMELVRHIFNRVIDNSRYAEPAARLCTTIIEKEKNETFLESLLNSCREWYHERDRLLRNFSSASQGGQTTSTNHRWIAYVTFMYEMYARLKTRQRSSGAALTGTSAVTAGPMLLSLLCECCQVFLKPPSLMNLSEIECLFFVLTSIGRDLENELPQRMHQLVAAVRDAFVNPSIPSFIRKTLLQLIELHASNWQLTTPAVTYYYPGSQERK